MKKIYLSNPVPVRAVEYDGTNFDECREFPGISMTENAVGENELILTENGTAKIVNVNSVLYLDQAGLLHVVSNAEFHERFTEYEERIVGFGEALEMLKQGKKVTRKGWSDGATVEIVAMEGMQPFLAVTSCGSLKPFTPGSDSLLAEDWTEVIEEAAF